MTEHCDPVADMISEGGPVVEPMVVSRPIVGTVSTSELSDKGPVTLMIADIPFGAAVVDKGEAQTRMVGEGGNSHGQH